MLLERRSIDNRFRVVVGIQHRRFATLGCIFPKADQRPEHVLDDIVVKVDKSRNMLRRGTFRIFNGATPQVALSKSDEIKTSDDAEIIPATFESLPQVRI